MKISLKLLKEYSSKRPDGYYDDVVSKGRIEGSYLEITPSAYNALLQRYNNQTTIQNVLNNVIPLLKRESCCSKSMPSVPVQLSNVIGAMVRVGENIINNKPVLISDIDRDKRLEICGTCEHYNIEKKRCSICGCKMSIKVALSSEKCPNGKW